jgi:pilus assembly protein CpaB
MKFALRLPKLNRSWLMLAGAIVLGLVATGLSHKLLKDYMVNIDAKEAAAHKMITVVVAKQDLPRGTQIQQGLFALRKVPADYLHASSVKPDSFNDYAGQRLGAPLRRGEPLLQVYLESTTAVFSSTLESGNRALTTEVDEVNSISGLLRPTDHIDLMATAHGSGSSSQTETTFPLLSNVEVLATGQVTRKAEGTNQARMYTTITLSVNPEDAERIVVAKNSGKLTAILRNPDDARPNSMRAMSIDDVVPKKPKAANQIAVQYIVGGRS